MSTYDTLKLHYGKRYADEFCKGGFMGRGHVWTAEEDQIVMDKTLKGSEKADRIGVTRKRVEARKFRLKHKGNKISDKEITQDKEINNFFGTANEIAKLLKPLTLEDRKDVIDFIWNILA